MPYPQSLRRILLALAGLSAMLSIGVATARAEYGELGGSPVVLTGKVSESTLDPHALGVDPTDGSFYVGDEIIKIEGLKELHFYRIQKFSATGEALAEAQIKAKEESTFLTSTALEGIAVDASAKRLYVLVDRRRDPEPEEGEPVLDPEIPAASTLYAFSTEVKNAEHKLEPAEHTKSPEGALVGFNPQSETPKVALLYPHGIAIDPTNGEVVIVGQEDEDAKAGEPEQLRTVVQRVRSSGTLGPRYVDMTNCLDGGVGGSGAGAEPACEEGLGLESQPFSPIVAPGAEGSSEGRVYVERAGEIWEIPSSATEIEPKRFETHPKRLFPTAARQEFGSEQALIEFPKSGEEQAEEVGGTMSFMLEGAKGEGKIYLTSALITNTGKGTVTSAGALILGYAEHAGTPEAKELGWTGGQSESSGEKCSIPKKGNGALLIAGGEKESLFLLDAHQKIGQSSPGGVDLFEFGSGGAGCPHAVATTPSVKVKNSHGEEVEVSPVPLGEAATLSSEVADGNVKSVQWKFKNLTTQEEETIEEPGYEFQVTSPKPKFEHTGEYEITEIIETDDLASPRIEVAKHEVKVAATPLAVEFSYPATNTAGQAVQLEATVTDSHESGARHLKYVWKFGDGEEKSGEATSTAFNEAHTYQSEGEKTITLKVTDGHGVSGEVTHTISVGKAEEHQQEHKEEHKVEAPKEGPKVEGPKVESLPEATLAGTSLSVTSSGAVTLKVTCPAGDSSCSGTVTLRTLGAVAAGHRKGKHKVVLTLASGSFTVAGAQVAAVTLHLSAAARALLARLHVLRVQATLVAHNPAGASHTTLSTVTLRAATKSKHRRKH